MENVHGDPDATATSFAEWFDQPGALRLVSYFPADPSCDIDLPFIDMDGELFELHHIRD